MPCFLLLQGGGLCSPSALSNGVRTMESHDNEVSIKLNEMSNELCQLKKDVEKMIAIEEAHYKCILNAIWNGGCTGVAPSTVEMNAEANMAAGVDIDSTEREVLEDSAPVHEGQYEE